MRTPIRPQARLSNSRRNQSAVDRGNQPQDKQRQSSRWLVSFCLFLFAGAMIFARLFYIQVYASEGLHQIAIEQRTISLVTQARRGTIYDRNGLVLATSVDTVSIYANTLQITNPEATAYLLAEVLGNDSEYWLEKISNPPANATNVCLARFADLQVQTDLLHRSQELEPYYLSISRLQSRLDPNGSPVWNAPTALSCVNFDHEYKRVYPYGSIGSQAIGTVNAEGRGISGIEMQYDQILTGQNGAIRVEIGYDGTPLPNGTRVEEPKADGED
ncbi:MAG: hypothetical protein LBU61_04945, partial [Coriobacteriales bacterium]|nr:hypothetical protein [Coriobacteriales bacterium]